MNMFHDGAANVLILKFGNTGLYGGIRLSEIQCMERNKKMLEKVKPMVSI